MGGSCFTIGLDGSCEMSCAAGKYIYERYICLELSSDYHYFIYTHILRRSIGRSLSVDLKTCMLEDLKLRGLGLW